MRMRPRTGSVGRMAAPVLAAVLLSGVMAASGAGEMKPGGHEHEGGAHGSMPMEQGARMGEAVYSGALGPWTAEVRLVDMKAEMAKMKASAAMIAKMAHTHHILVFLAEGGKETPAAGVRGTVAVTGPDKAQSRADLIAMGDHAGADIKLPNPGRYEFRIDVAANGRKGQAAFAWTLKGP